jgi:hypothetical protein
MNSELKAIGNTGGKMTAREWITSNRRFCEERVVIEDIEDSRRLG